MSVEKPDDDSYLLTSLICQAMYPKGYFYVAVERCPNLGSSNASVRVRPLPGQGLDCSMYVECSRSMRNRLTDKTVAVIQAKLTSRESGTPFLYSYFGDSYEIISREEAVDRISRGEFGPKK